MKVGDAIILREADHYGVQALITWNKKDFEDRTSIPLFSPLEFADKVRDGGERKKES